MKTWWTAFGMVVAACGGGGASGTDPGEGTQTLIVAANASISSGDPGWSLEVEVGRPGAPMVTDAEVRIESDAGDMVLAHVENGRYAGSLPADATAFALSVEAGEDGLSASLDAPAIPELEHPAVTGFDPHAEEDGLVEVRWSGAAAQRVRVKVAEFEYEGVDQGSIDVPATTFQDDEEELEVERRNSVTLLGGLGGSTFEAKAETKTRVGVTNPF